MSGFDEFFGTADSLLDGLERGQVGFWKDDSNIYHFYGKEASEAVCGKVARNEPHSRGGHWRAAFSSGRVMPFCTDCLNKAAEKINDGD